MSVYCCMNKHSILIIDDSSVGREVFQIACTGLECSVDVISSGDEAIRLFQDKHHDFVLTDYQMPVIDGVDLVIALRKIEPTVPCLIFTGFPDQRVEDFCKHTQQCSYFVKPVALRQMVQILSETIQASAPKATALQFEQALMHCPLLADNDTDTCELRAQISRLRHENSAIIIEGGDFLTRKAIAQLLHDYGPRYDHRLIEHSCRMNEDEAVWRETIQSDGRRGPLIQQAIGGSLLLNDLQYLSLETQAHMANHFDMLFENIRLITTIDHTKRGLRGPSLHLQLYRHFAQNAISLPINNQLDGQLSAMRVAN